MGKFLINIFSKLLAKKIFREYHFVLWVDTLPRINSWKIHRKKNPKTIWQGTHQKNVEVFKYELLPDTIPDETSARIRAGNTGGIRGRSPEEFHG